MNSVACKQASLLGFQGGAGKKKKKRLQIKKLLNLVRSVTEGTK